nr:PREDICTED: potassium channel subfamily K member 5 [Latimeria chalumnae]|eukprot:XP_014351473.1 PREDICTED: potassium channel subfamily K member 5 [Latimeria chalumnae]
MRVRSLAPALCPHSDDAPETSDSCATESKLQSAQAERHTRDRARGQREFSLDCFSSLTLLPLPPLGYGNIAPKTAAGRVFCIFYGLFGVPLCLTWVSALGKFFGGRAKRLGQFLTKRGVSLRKAQIICTAIFILWGVLVHLVVPPFVFMVTEGWSYIEGLYFSFITISTVGFGDLVTGVDPNTEYHVLYRYFVEIWIYLGLAWLSLFINWKVSMFVEVHKAIKKRRKRRKESYESDPHPKKALQLAKSNDVKIFSFLSKKQEGYNDLIKQIGTKNMKNGGDTVLNMDVSSKPRQPVSTNTRDAIVMYTKNKCFQYEEPRTLNCHEMSEVLSTLNVKDAVDSHFETTMFMNQLGKSHLERNGTWDNQREYCPLIFRNANIGFMEGDTFLRQEEEEEEKKERQSSELSVEENLEEEGEEEPGTPSKVIGSSESEESIFTSDESEHSMPYEQLINEYKKMNNIDIIK